MVTAGVCHQEIRKDTLINKIFYNKTPTLLKAKKTNPNAVRSTRQTSKINHHSTSSSESSNDEPCAYEP